MNNGTMMVVMVLLSPVVVALLEATKLLGARFDWNLSGPGKLKLTLIVSFVIGTVAALSSGELSITGIIQDIMALVARPPGFFEFFPALAAIFSEIATAVGTVTVVSQAVYALLKKQLYDSGWLSALYTKFAYS